MTAYCPICGHAFSAVELVLFENDVNFQCKHCWNRVRPTKLRQAAKALIRARNSRTTMAPRRRAA
ncbi:MAG: hypothetical protein ACRD5G_12640 [Candidatus Acidiferrales bacterium]